MSHHLRIADRQSEEIHRRQTDCNVESPADGQARFLLLIASSTVSYSDRRQTKSKATMALFSAVVLRRGSLSLGRVATTTARHQQQQQQQQQQIMMMSSVAEKDNILPVSSCSYTHQATTTTQRFLMAGMHCGGNIIIDIAVL